MERERKRRFLLVALLALAALGGWDRSGAVTSALGAQAKALAGTAREGQSAMGFTADGHPYRGDPKAPVIVEEYSDYLCPYCGRHFTDTLPALLEKYAATGRIEYVYRDFRLASLHPTSAKGHEASLCVAEQGQFWAMHHRPLRAAGAMGHRRGGEGPAGARGAAQARWGPFHGMF